MSVALRFAKAAFNRTFHWNFCGAKGDRTRAVDCQLHSKDADECVNANLQLSLEARGVSLRCGPVAQGNLQLSRRRSK
jgi:hypothetical protein